MRSPPARVAWIETHSETINADTGYTVATREGGVDRNGYEYGNIFDIDPVATREGGVDRNVRKE